VGGVLVFGRDRERHFPDAWIQAGRFDGLDKSQDPRPSRVPQSTVGAIEDAIAFIEKHSLYSADIGRVRRTDRWNLPPVAVREAVINAVAHADYAQRGALRFVSRSSTTAWRSRIPGLLPFGPHGRTTSSTASPSSATECIGRVFHALGLIEQWGKRHVQRMTAACRDAGLADPRLEEIATRFRVTIFTSNGSIAPLDDTDQAIVDGLSDGEGKLTSEIAAVIGLTSRATRTRLARLVGNGLVREVGSGPQDPKRPLFPFQAPPLTNGNDLLGILTNCTPRADVLAGDLKDAIFAADFGDVISGHAGAPEVYLDPQLFFRNTHPARDLVRIVPRGVRGRSQTRRSPAWRCVSARALAAARRIRCSPSGTWPATSPSPG
jgi:hypothetical protein